jgi:hypothetical protein
MDNATPRKIQDADRDRRIAALRYDVDTGGACALAGALEDLRDATIGVDDSLKSIAVMDLDTDALMAVVREAQAMYEDAVALLTERALDTMEAELAADEREDAANSSDQEWTVAAAGNR